MKIRPSSVSWTILGSVFLTLLSQVGTVKHFSELSGMKNSAVRPEITISQFAIKSFDPQAGTVSSDCQRDSALYHNGLENYKPWALQMYDASTKIPSSILTGNTKQLGNYDECLKVKSEHGFVGKACSAKVQFVISGETSETGNNDEIDMGDLLISMALASGLANWTSGISVPYEWLWCVPSSCSSRDISETIELGLDALKHSQRVDFIVQVGNKSCHTKESDRRTLDIADWLYISLLILFGCLVAISTSYDLIKQRNPVKPDPKDVKRTILRSFSAYANWKSLLNVQRGSGSIDCLDGLRFLSICWIIYGHTHYITIVGVDLDLSSVAKMHESWDTLLLLNGNLATDTFLLLSGLLLAHTELRMKEKNFDNRRLNIWNFYVQRYLRLTPAYAMIIGFYATLFYKIGSGPHWDIWVGENQNFCRENWWTNLLYVNNYVNVPNMCMSQSWYLSVDMQLLWISPIFLYPMLGNGKKYQLIFLIVLITGFLASVLTPLFITYFNELTGTMFYYKNQMDLAEVYLQIYIKTYTRAGPYLLGIGLGYLLKKINPQNITIPTSYVIVGWCLTTLAGLAVVFGPRGMYYPDHDYDNVEAAFYAGFHRPVFALAVGWIIVASIFDSAGPVGALLSWSFWVPLSKLTYSAYLTQYIILLYNAGSVRTPEHITTFHIVQKFFGNLVTILIISVILSLTFEIPFIRLINLWKTRSTRAPCVTKKSVVRQCETSESIHREIYRAFDKDISKVSRTYEDLMERYTRVSIESLPRTECSNDGTNPCESESSIDFNNTQCRENVTKKELE